MSRKPQNRIEVTDDEIKTIDAAVDVLMAVAGRYVDANPDMYEGRIDLHVQDYRILDKKEVEWHFGPLSLITQGRGKTLREAIATHFDMSDKEVAKRKAERLRREAARIEASVED